MEKRNVDMGLWWQVWEADKLQLAACGIPTYFARGGRQSLPPRPSRSNTAYHGIHIRQQSGWKDGHVPQGG
jgi:hypothetical protein